MKKIRKHLVHTLLLTSAFTLCAGLCAGCGKQSGQQSPKEDDTSTVEQKKESIKSYYKASDFEEIISDKGKEILGYFDGIISYQEALEDVSEIDLTYDEEFDKSEYTEKVIKDEENDTKIYQYYDGEDLVYEQYDNFSEDAYTKYTKTKKGLDAKVNYFEEEFAAIEKYHTISIVTDDYTVTFMNPEAEEAEEREIKVGLVKEEDDRPEFLTFALVGDHVILESADYCTEEGYKTYSSWLEEDGVTLGEVEEAEDIDLSDLNISENMQKIKAYDGDYKIHALLGPHILTDQEGHWYLIADLFMIFDSKEEAEEYAANIGLDNESVSQNYLEEDAKQYHVECQKMAVPLSKNFTADGKNIREFVDDVYDDWTFRVVTFNENDEVESLNYGDDLLLSVG